MGEAAVPVTRTPPRAAGLLLLGDERLARHAAAGDTHAFAAIYQRHHQGLYRFCRSILGDPDDAADALQNTMLAVLRALPGERRRIDLKPWLYRIAHNEAVTLLRRRPRAPFTEPGEGTLSAAGTSPGAEGDAALRERMRDLVADLRDLPDRQRGALVMRELSGLAYGEIGAALDVSEAAAKQAVYEARVALHDLAEGRAMDCDHVRRALSERDRRRLRGRKLRAHMRACGLCRRFEASLAERPAELRALAPGLPAGAATALLEGIVGTGGAGGVGGGLLATAGATVAKLGGATGALKGAAAGMLAVIAGAGVVELAPHGAESTARGAGVAESSGAPASVAAGVARAAELAAAAATLPERRADAASPGGAPAPKPASRGGSVEDLPQGAQAGQAPVPAGAAGSGHRLDPGGTAPRTGSPTQPHDAGASRSGGAGLAGEGGGTAPRQAPGGTPKPAVPGAGGARTEPPAAPGPADAPRGP